MAPQRYIRQAVAQAHLAAVMAVVEIAKTQWGQSTFYQDIKYSDPIFWMLNAVEMYSDPKINVL